MECPSCKSRTLIYEKTKRVCKLPECFFEDQHPISFDNDVRHYEGQKNGENRFSTLYNSALDHGGISMDKQANFDKQLKKGQKYIKDICLLLKLSQKIQSTAQARFITILKLKIKGKLQKQQNDEMDNNEKKSTQKKKVLAFSIRELACYSVYSACFQNHNFFQDFNLAKWLKVHKKDWEILLKDINSELKKKIDFIPNEEPWHLVLRVCRKRKIEKPEQNAMIQMCNRISKNGIQDGRPRKTVAACVFWKICENSQTYYHKIKLADICRKQDQLAEMSIGQAQKYFECIPDTIKKFFNEKMQANFYKEYLPQWDGMRKNIPKWIANEQ